MCDTRKLLRIFVRQCVIDCYQLMGMDAERTARSLSAGLTPEEMRDIADILLETDKDTRTDEETALEELSARVAEALAELADDREDGHIYLAVRKGGETQ